MRVTCYASNKWNMENKMRDMKFDKNTKESQIKKGKSREKVNLREPERERKKRNEKEGEREIESKKKSQIYMRGERRRVREKFSDKQQCWIVERKG